MSDQASKDAAAKARIITHMNADHHGSVIRYLENYHHLPGYQAYHGKISDISLEYIAFECAGLNYRTALEPPMTSFREARERLVQMDKECVEALGRSDITVKEFLAPTGVYLVSFIVISATFVAFRSRGNFEAGSAIAAVVPGAFARFCWTIQPFIWYGMLSIHSLETWHMARGRLRKHNVNIRSRVWWSWMATTFIEGVGAYNRFDKMVKEKRAEKDKQKH
ncbi:hypothetical protein E4T48_04450 [Aureobasidium sp. EXF-10727]|nr:hypothetical protein E4T48_04450 [Aureobasidium sp. EXF-10727]